MRYMKARSCDVDGRRCSRTPRPSIAASMLQLTDADDVSKRKQLCITVKVFVIISIPLLVLIGLVGWHTIHAGRKVLAGQEVRASMEFFNQNANLVHALQDERISGAYMLLTGHDFNAKHAIQAKINVTDEQLLNIKGVWPQPVRMANLVSRKNIANFDDFTAYLAQIRKSVLENSITVYEDIEYYHDLITYLMYALIAELSSIQDVPLIWNHLVAMENIIKCEEYSGMTVSLGLEYYLSSCELSDAEYREFLRYDALSQESLYMVLSHNDFSKDLFDQMNGSFSRTRQDVVLSLKSTNSCSEAFARTYVTEMTQFIRRLTNMSLQVRARINKQVERHTKEALTEMMLTLFAALAILVASPILVASIHVIIQKLYHTSQECIDKSKALSLERQRAKKLLYKMLPPLVASKLMSGEEVPPENFEKATIFFSDVVDFTSLAFNSTPFEVVVLLDALYVMFDGVIEEHDVYKVLM